MVKFVEQVVFFDVKNLDDFLEWSRHLKTNSKMYIREDSVLTAYAFTSPIPIKCIYSANSNKEVDQKEHELISNGFVGGEFVSEELGK